MPPRGRTAAARLADVTLASASRCGGASSIGETTLSSPITVRIKRAPGASDLPLPLRMTADAAGFDLPAAVTEPVTLAPGERRLIPCGFHMALPPGYEAQVRPRSG